MQILCDHHVPPKYVQAFEQEPDITVTTVRDSLSHDASDAEIAAFASREDWIVYTNDDDFFRHTPSHGLVVYNQRENPAPGAVVDAMIAIDRTYVSPGEIHEFVPDGWVYRQTNSPRRHH